MKKTSRNSIVVSLIIVVLIIIGLLIINKGNELLNIIVNRTINSTALIIITPSRTYVNEEKPPINNADFATEMAYWTQIAEQQALDCKGFPDPHNPPTPDEDKNETWRIAYCLDGKTGLPYTRIIKRDHTIVWEEPFYELYGINQKDKFHPNGIRDGIIKVVQWSNDEKYVYIAPWYCCADGPGLLFIDYFALYRLDLNNGDLKVIFPKGGSLAFSPDGKYLAFSDAPDQIHIQNINTDEDKVKYFNTKYEQIGLFSWSPDSRNLIIVGALKEWVENIVGYCDKNSTPISCGSKDGFSLLLLSSKEMKIEILIDNDIRLLRPEEQKDKQWIDNEKINLFDNEDNAYIYDIKLRKLILLPAQTP